MDAVTRRQALRLGGLGALGAGIGGVVLSRSGVSWAPAPSVPPSRSGGGELHEPTTVRSRDGLLRVDLVAAAGTADVAGRRAEVLAYDGTVPGPTWWVRPGDRLEVRLHNRLASPTNLHTHGLVVSPRGHGDNPFVAVEPGGIFDYRLDLPDDHPTGVFWYHPHAHGHAADQVFGGLYGAIVVADDDVPVTRERVLVVSDISLARDGTVVPASPHDLVQGREGRTVLVDGQVRPHLTARPGARERWRVVNACTSRYLRLALPGQDLALLGVDGGHEPAPRRVAEVLLAPGNRADLLVTTRAGTSELRHLGHDRGGVGMRGGGLSGPVALASFEIAGRPVRDPGPLPRRPSDRDLRDAVVVARREIVVTMAGGMGGMGGAGGMGGMADVGFDGRSFDPARVDQRVAAGTVEEWTLTNPTPMAHPFHLHAWPMQVVEADGRAVDGQARRDVVDIPAHGRVRVLADFGRHPGRSVYHCHILDHEDAGMMGVVEVR